MPAKAREDGSFLLGATPGVAEGLAAGDIIRLCDEKPGFVIVKRGDNFGVWLWSDERLAPDHPDVERATVLAVSLGGLVDGGTSRSLVLTIPSASGLDRIARTIDAWVQSHPRFVWEFTNVYPREDDHSTE